MRVDKSKAITVEHVLQGQIFQERRFTCSRLSDGIDVPLSVTQSEQITALRAWADVRAVAASAPEDRAGYVTKSAEAAPPAVGQDAELARGGRPIEA